MAKYNVNVAQSLSNTDDLEELEQELIRQADRVKELKNDISISAINDIKIKQELSVISNNIIRMAAHMATFSDALQTVMNQYEAVENRILDGNEYASASLAREDSSTIETGTDKRGWWRKFWDWLTQKDLDEYTATTGEQESVSDKRLQSKIEKLTNSEMYSQERWEDASIEEREEILNSYMNDVAKILGVNVKKSIRYFHEEPKYNPQLDTYVIRNGYYSDFSRGVSINTFEGMPYEVMTVVVHELRHAYQHEAIRHPERFQVSQETIDKWKHSFAIYQQEQNKGFDYYWALEVEKDARWFAGQE